jgi:hypothetical protein
MSHGKKKSKKRLSKKREKKLSIVQKYSARHIKAYEAESVQPIINNKNYFFIEIQPPKEESTLTILGKWVVVFTFMKDFLLLLFKQ